MGSCVIGCESAKHIEVMSEVHSTFMLSPGVRAPDFSLPDSRGKLHYLAQLRGENGLVVAFLCNHCPFVIHLARSLGSFAEECIAGGVGFVGINANDVARYPADHPQKMMETAEQFDWSFPYLYDQTQQTAQAYRAACTPDFYLFNRDLELTYCGQFDDSRPGNGREINGNDLRRALAGMLAGEPPVPNQRPSSGCNIKWKPGNEPLWFSV